MPLMHLVFKERLTKKHETIQELFVPSLLGKHRQQHTPQAHTWWYLWCRREEGWWHGVGGMMGVWGCPSAGPVRGFYS